MHSKKIEWLTLGAVVVLVFAGLQFWKAYERNRASDIRMASVLSLLKTGLGLYYHVHAAYPGTAAGAPLLLGGTPQDLSCITEKGFFSNLSGMCDERGALRLFLPWGYEVDGHLWGYSISYQPLESDGVTACGSEVSCPSYEATFQTKTTSFLKPAGAHRLTPQGLQ